MEGNGTRLGTGCIRAVLLALTVLALAGEPARGQQLNGEISMLLQRAQLSGVNIGISVVDLANGRVLASRSEDDLFIPASNQKLLTSGTALSVLGSDYAFTTDFIVQGDTLVVRGSGDPGFADPELLKDMEISADEFLGRIVQTIASADVGGLSRIVVDDRVFDRDYVHAEWPEDQLNRWYCAQVSGLNFHCNVLSIYASAESSGIVTLEPDVPWFRITKNVKRVRKGSTVVGADRVQGTNDIQVFGQVRQSLRTPIEVSVHEGSLMFGGLLAARLRAAGLTDGEPSVEVAEAGMMPPEEAEGTIVARVQTTMATVLERCNTDSHNLYAESLIKALGHKVTSQPGSWANGTAVVRMHAIDQIGAASGAAIRVSDGSGMSRANRMSPTMMSRWLRSIWLDRDIRNPFVTSLATPGKGTLRNRFRGATLEHDVYAKSGYLSGVRTLSGYVVDPSSGRALAFSILVNNIPKDVRHATIKKFMEDAVVKMDAWLGAQAPAQPELVEVPGG